MILTKRLARGRFYYGWYVVGTAFLAQMMTNGMQSYTFGIFIKPIYDDVGWTRGEFSAVQSVSTLVSGLLALFIGPFLDRRGARTLMVAGAFITGISLASLSLVQELWQFYLLRGVFVTAGIISTGNLVVNVAISNWFVRKRGRAVAIGAMGMSMAGIVLPTLTQSFIGSYGWRTAWAILGLMVVLVVAPTAGLLMRRRPEDFGLLPDGEQASSALPPQATQAAAAKQTAKRVEYPWQRREAMRTSSLWLIVLTFSLAGMAQGAILLHIFPFLSDRGLSPEEAATGVSIMGLAGLISKPFWGFLMEKIPCKFVAASDFAAAAIGLALMLAVPGGPALYAAIPFLGLGIGGFVVVQEVIWADYFGRLTLGAIRSVGIPPHILSSAGGPVFAGVAYDATGSYLLAFSLFAAAYLAAGLILLVSRRPVPPVAGGTAVELSARSS